MIGKILNQVNDKSIKPISGLDATFLYIESPTNHMHVGGVAVIQGSLQYEDFRATIQRRIHLIPSLRKRLMSVPFSVDYPYWVDDPDFDLDLHLHRVALPKPGSWKELRAVASQIFSEPLDKSRPLWSFTFIEGLDSIPQLPEGSVAIVSKIHHVAIDGMAGAGILSIMFDMSPEPFIDKHEDNFDPKPLPNDLALIAKSTAGFAKNPFKFPKLIAEAVGSTIKAGFLTRARHLKPPTSPFSAPHTPLNGIISARRKWNTAILSLARIKKLKNIMECTLNDVMLAICAGALRRYLEEKGKLPNKPLVAHVPISTGDMGGNGSNNLSVMLVQLATDVEDPIERLEMIHENTVRGKTYQGALGAKTLSSMAEVVPFGVANQAAKLYTRFHLSEMHSPVFNVTITNVPGPQIPLYLNGHKLESIMGMAPIIDGMGLIITIFSYNGQVTISPTSDARTMPDINIFTRYLRESANDLEAVILEYEKNREKEEAQQESKPMQSEAFFRDIKVQLKGQSDLLQGQSGLFQFTVTGSEEVHWRVDLDKPGGGIRKGKVRSPFATFTISDEHLMMVARREIDIPTAFVQGRLRVEGDMDQAMKLGKLLSKLEVFGEE
ncbi:MAG TPA: wax ester/triacylglycerol synthase family O-acyltransferase [Saprospiraceae bacterium]|nr:wax ester/triacylglycerol synthase family O-acyltransferase [Saprospiraceae bacterium]